MANLNGKVAIVTGGAAGIGKHYSRALAEAGAIVQILDIVDGTSYAAEIGATFHTCDIADESAVSRTVDAITASCGRIDILVNNAALYSSLPLARYDEIDTALWDQVMSVNVTGTFQMIRAIGPVMEAQGSGKIINITSGTTKKGMPNMLHYITSKGALVAMTRSLSRELGARNICINNLSPGLILSDSITANEDHVAAAEGPVIASRALKRHGYPEDLLGALLFLASDASNFITGQTIAVDGGSVNT